MRIRHVRWHLYILCLSLVRVHVHVYYYVCVKLYGIYSRLCL
jgi:hypothetical protein